MCIFSHQLEDPEIEKFSASQQFFILVFAIAGGFEVLWRRLRNKITRYTPKQLW